MSFYVWTRRPRPWSLSHTPRWLASLSAAWHQHALGAADNPRGRATPARHVSFASGAGRTSARSPLHNGRPFPSQFWRAWKNESQSHLRPHSTSLRRQAYQQGKILFSQRCLAGAELIPAVVADGQSSFPKCYGRAPRRPISWSQRVNGLARATSQSSKYSTSWGTLRGKDVLSEECIFAGSNLFSTMMHRRWCPLITWPRPTSDGEAFQGRKAHVAQDPERVEAGPAREREDGGSIAVFNHP